jgi:hypothetical protein
MVATAGVHAVDLNGCLPPQDHVPTAAEEAAWTAAGICRPRWCALILLAAAGLYLLCCFWWPRQ